jgi:glucokinase
VKYYFEKTGTRTEGVKDIADAAAKNPAARELFREYGSNMGLFLAPWIEKFDAGIIVIGGNITGAFDLFGGYLENALKQQNIDIEIHLSDLKEDAAIIGGARLVVEDYWTRVKDLLSFM